MVSLISPFLKYKSVNFFFNFNKGGLHGVQTFSSTSITNRQILSDLWKQWCRHYLQVDWWRSKMDHGENRKAPISQTPHLYWRKHTIIGPGDIELHRGNDGKIYVIDVARLMPPDLEPTKKSSIFYQHFRPEFIKWYKKPLSSDAYSRFGTYEKLIHNSEVNFASQVLREERIPKFAQMIKPPEGKNFNLNWIATEMKHRGINAR